MRPTGRDAHSLTPYIGHIGRHMQDKFITYQRLKRQSERYREQKLKECCAFLSIAVKTVLSPPTRDHKNHRPGPKATRALTLDQFPIETTITRPPHSIIYIPTNLFTSFAASWATAAVAPGQVASLPPICDASHPSG